MQQNQFSVEGYEVILGILVQEGYIGVGTVNKLLFRLYLGIKAAALTKSVE